MVAANVSKKVGIAATLSAKKGASIPKCVTHSLAYVTK
jgi:hypothetical protein